MPKLLPGLKSFFSHNGISVDSRISKDRWDDDKRNPFNWSPLRKWLVFLTSCLATAIVGLNATAIATGANAVTAEFNVSNDIFEYSYLTITAWNTAAALVPLATLPLMEAYGMRTGYLASYVLFTIFIIPQALAPNFATLIVTRVIAGAFGGTVLNAIDGIIANMWRYERDRAFPMVIYIFSYLAGVTLGPVQGAIMGGEGGLGWRWIFWLELIVSAASIPLIFLLIPETRGSVILQQMNKHAVSEAGSDAGEDEGQGASSLMGTLKTAWQTATLAVKMLLKSPVLASFTLLSSFTFALVFAAADSVPLVFSTAYGFSDEAGGLMQLPVFLGEIVGLFISILNNGLYLRSASRHRGSAAAQQKEGNGTPVPETILYASVLAIPLFLAGGLFIYGFTALYAGAASIPWPVPALGLLLQGAAVQIVVTAVGVYITDFYPMQAASAISAVAAGENLLAAFLPLCIKPLYVRAGFGWGSGVLGFVSLVLGLAPAVLLWKGESLRLRSRPVT